MQAIVKPACLTTEELAAVRSLREDLRHCYEILGIIEHGFAVPQNLESLAPFLTEGSAPCGDHLTFSGGPINLFRSLTLAMEGKCRTCNGLVHSTDPKTMCECPAD